MRIDSSSGKSVFNRLAICSGDQPLTHFRSPRCGLLRPLKGACLGPAIAWPCASRTSPSKRSLTYWSSRALLASFAGFGRLANRSAFHCATEARYSRYPPRVAALRVSSLETVDGLRPMRRAISRTPTFWIESNAIYSRSANDKYRPAIGFDMNSGIPPQ